MKTYEFWDDMGKIFDAIVAYQEKTIEFNKRFINPWVKLGNVFDKEESSKAIAAHKNAIEINPDNAQIWYDLASAHGRAGEFDKSIQAYQKANELGLESGELYKNLAMAYVMAGDHQEAIPYLEKSLALFESPEDKSAIWNHLGNAYRKLNNYDMALEAFQQADEYAGDVSDIEDSLPEVGPDASQPTDEPATAMEEDEAAAAEEGIEETEVPQVQQEELHVESPTETEHDDTEADEAAEELGAEEGEDLPIILELDFSTESPEAEAEEEVEVNEDFEDEVESEFLAALENGADQELVQEEASGETTDVENEAEIEDLPEPEAVPESPPEMEQTLDPSETVPTPSQEVMVDTENFEEPVDLKGENVEIETTSDEDIQEKEALEDSIDITSDETDFESTPEEPVSTTLSAYDEFLKDNENIENVNLEDSNSQEAESLVRTPIQADLPNSEGIRDTNPDMALDADTKNAHVWNELGNVYFNAGSFDDAIAAYSKAIELDEAFAWPYTNLAMSYVQKDRLEESVLLYQRSIELFSNEKDKAVTWNRLGNVYRRLNDYEKAIAAYQRADELDPDNIAITQQARFSLLGSENFNQEIEYSV